MKTAFVFSFVALFACLISSLPAHAQPANPPTPTTRILAIGTLTAAHEMLEKLPLGVAHLMSFELIPLGPLNPLRQLLGPPTGSE
jgi:hypothetical protein